MSIQIDEKILNKLGARNKAKLEYWNQNIDELYNSELEKLVNDSEALKSAFDGELAFGTAGIRGKMSLGPNALNVYTIRKTAQGVALFLKKKNKGNIKIAISYDSRINSEIFAIHCANIFNSHGIEVLMFCSPTATPILAYSVSILGCSLGVMITASHNAPEYNGLKIFDSTGVQYVDTKEITKTIEKLDIFKDVPKLDIKKIELYESVVKTAVGVVALTDSLSEENKLPHTIFSETIPDFSIIQNSIVDKYINHLDTLCVHSDDTNLNNIKVVYTPLNGTGGAVMSKLFDRYNVDYKFVSEQAMPDGTFETCKAPNPENRDSFKLALNYAEQTDADIVVATDPDADRVGVVIKYKSEYRFLSGNELGILLAEFLLNQNLKKPEPIASPMIVRTVVSTNLIDKIAEHFGARVETVLTGFKNIGTKMHASTENTRDFLLGFEESMGYLSGTHIGDKDAFVTTLLTLQMLAAYKRSSKTLLEKLDEIYTQYGYSITETLNFEKGLNGNFEKLDAKTMTRIMGWYDNSRGMDYISGFRGSYGNYGGGYHGLSDDYKALEFIDYDEDFSDPMLCANMLEYHIQNDVTIIVRPSGTEPKLKIYIMIFGKDKENNIKLMNYWKTRMYEIMVELYKSARLDLE